ncbi:MAG: beta-propeller fold lactonase family protein [Acidobacteria bacterium]|nr:beta-propeller fold lactonase family protein [Acidobacteriota bacterium]MCB9398628.1 beta-propeller fold lactonase family protein [Acidobacteriota bacterium]
MKFGWILMGVTMWAQVEFIDVALEGVSGVTGISGAEELTLSPDGRHVYVTGAAGNSVAAFERLPDGTLTMIAAYFDGLDGLDGLFGAQGVRVSADGLDVYVTGAGEDKLAHFRRSDLTGELTFVRSYSNTVGGPTAMLGPVRLTLDPSDKHLYVSCVTSGSIVIFRRDPLDGSLTYSGTATDGMGYDGLAGASGLAFDGAGRFLFVCGSGEDAIAVLERDGLTGLLSFVAVYRDGMGGIDGIAGTNALAISGRYLYATGFNDSALASFRITLATGALSFLGASFDGVGPVDGLAGPIGVAVSADGGQVMVAGFSDDALAVFDRSGETLLFRQVVFDGSGGVDGLAGAVGVISSADGKHVYATGFSDSGVAQFERVSSLGSLIETWADLTSILDLVTYVSAYP